MQLRRSRTWLAFTFSLLCLLTPAFANLLDENFAFQTTPGNPIWLWDWLYGSNQVMYLEPVK